MPLKIYRWMEGAMPNGIVLRSACCVLRALGQDTGLRTQDLDDPPFEGVHGQLHPPVDPKFFVNCV